MSYKSRLPEIAAELAVKMDAVALAGAERIASEAQNRVPVATGRLKNAIHTERVRVGGYAVVAGDNETFYGHIVEHGGAYTPAKPFLIPALEDNRAEIIRFATLALRTL